MNLPLCQIFSVFSIAMQTPSVQRFAEAGWRFFDGSTINDQWSVISGRWSKKVRLPEWNYNVEAGWAGEIRSSQPGRGIRLGDALCSFFLSESQ
jgi:hypothetical protein